MKPPPLPGDKRKEHINKTMSGSQEFQKEKSHAEGWSHREGVLGRPALESLGGKVTLETRPKGES